MSHCGKEIRVNQDRQGEKITLSQNGFIDGRLQKIEIDRQRTKLKEERATESEKTDFRSVVGSLQWLVTQSRPDLSFEINQLQKRINDLRVNDLIRANKAVKEVCSNRLELVFRNLGPDAEVVVYHDGVLFNSVGAEIHEQDDEDILQTVMEKKLVYSQKGVILGMVKKGQTDKQGEHIHFNVLDWRSSTNRRVVESSFAAETHPALMAHGMLRFAHVLLAEIRFGSCVIATVEDDGWQSLVTTTLVTDCRSIYDTVHKDGQHINEKGSVVHAVLLRQLLPTRRAEGKARLMWVPTRCQFADPLSKAGKSCELRQLLEGGPVFHEAAKPRWQKQSGQKDSGTGVKVVRFA